MASRTIEPSTTDLPPLKYRGWLIVALFAGIFIGTDDQTFVVTILPQMMADLDISADRLGDSTWIVNGYLLGYVLALPTLGRAGDVLGRVRIYVAAALLFAAGSAAVALSPTLGTVALTRAISAVGGGALVPLGLAIAADAVSERRRPLVLGTLLAAQNASSLTGPLWGAAFEALIGWRGVFWLNVPMILPVAVAVPLLGRAHDVRSHGRLDLRGVGLFIAGLVAVTVGLSDDPSAPRPIVLSVGLVIGGLACFVVFAWAESRTSSPMIDVRLFRRPPIAAANVIYLVVGGVLITAMVTVPLMQNTLYGGTTLDGALALMGLLLVLPVGGVAGGLLSGHLGYRLTAVLGLGLAAVGLLWMHEWRSSISPFEMWPALVCVGFGLGLCDAPLVSTVVENAERKQRVTSVAVILVLWTVGMIIGLALLGSRGLGRFQDRAADLFAERNLTVGSPEYLSAIHTTYNEVLLVAAGAVAVAGGLALLLKRGERPVRGWIRVPGLL